MQSLASLGEAVDSLAAYGAVPTASVVSAGVITNDAIEILTASCVADEAACPIAIPVVVVVVAAVDALLAYGVYEFFLNVPFPF